MYSFRFKAFTLIELLIVVAIIAILAAIAVPNFLEAQTRAKVSRAKADLRSVNTALESYYVDNNKYPPMADRSENPVIVDASIIDSSYTLKWITTPIAYISSLEACRDVFTQNAKVTNSFANPPMPAYEQTHVVYYNYEDLADAMGQPESAFTAFGMASMGPNIADDAACFRLFNWVAYPDQAWAITGLEDSVYNPTNGTISGGDIARFGGAIPSIASEIAGY